jgi:hypothetical protein
MMRSLKARLDTFPDQLDHPTLAGSLISSAPKQTPKAPAPAAVPSGMPNTGVANEEGGDQAEQRGPVSANAE